MKKIYKHLNILDGSKDMILKEDMDILVEDGIIKRIDRNINENGEVFDLRDKYIIPGLINLHVHTPGTGFPKKRQTDQRKLAKFVMSNPVGRIIAKSICKKSVEIQLKSGTTTIRTVGGLGNIDNILRDDIKNNKYRGPRIISCGSALTIPGGHMEGSVAYGARDNNDFISFIENNKKSGVDWLKIMITGGVLDAKKKGEPGEMKMSEHQIRICCEKAHELGLKVCAHVESPEGIKAALNNGVDCIEHGSYIDEETLKLFKEKNASLVCTLSPAIPLAKFDLEISKANEVVLYNARYLLEGMIEGVKTCLDNNISVGVGNDTVCPYITHYDFWRELEYIHKLLNISRKEVLYLATLANAKIINIAEITGSIHEGKYAEMLVVDENPLEGFSTIRNPYIIINRDYEIIKPIIEKSKEAEMLLDNYLESLN